MTPSHEKEPPSAKAGLPANLAPQAPGEVLSTMEMDGSRRWLMPTPVLGPWWKRRAVAGWVLVFAYILAPILHINGKPAIWLNLVAREFTILGYTFYAYDTLALVFFLLSIFLLIFLGTSLLGRLWCGWGCPQTVYLEFVFRPIEQWLEGPQGQKLRRATRLQWWGRKIAKYGIFVVVASVLAHTFLAYFVSWENLLPWLIGPPAEHWGAFVVVAFTTALILFDFAWFREQMCTVACPYARFQSVLLDHDSLIVSYDPGRGEPRGRRSREERKAELDGAALALGDCIDCGACVRCCPTGIDIREGLQMECVGCTQCIDACDEVMIKVQKPIGLIRYTSEAELEGQKTRILRPRVLGYTAAVIAAFIALGSVITAQGDLNIAVTRASAEPWVQLPAGDIGNRLSIRLQNRSSEPMTLRLEAVDPPEARVQIVGPSTISLSPGQMKRNEVWVVLPPEAYADGDIPAVFRAVDEEGATWAIRYTLIGPRPGATLRPARETAPSPPGD